MLVLSWHNITPVKRQRSFPGVYVPLKMEIVVTKIVDAQYFLTCQVLIKKYFNLKGRTILRESFCQLVILNLPQMCWMQHELSLIS